MCVMLKIQNISNIKNDFDPNICEFSLELYMNIVYIRVYGIFVVCEIKQFFRIDFVPLLIISY